MFSLALGFFKQLQRLIHATKLGCNRPLPKDVQMAVVKMRRLQIGLNLFQFLCGLVALLVAVGAIPPNWFVIPLMMTLEGGGSIHVIAVVVVNRLLGLHRKRKQRLTLHKAAFENKNAIIESDTAHEDNFKS